AERFSDISFMAYRDIEKMKQKQNELAQASVESDESTFFIAEQDGIFLGYIELKEETDYFTVEKTAYISAVAVASSGEGKGVGKKLMQKAEQWSKEKGLKQIVLDVFKANERAVDVYRHLGYDEEIVKMVKVIE
uniref:GNAT family N-acetyltransferase n=1 Tax=Bacillus sp. JCM 19041 TaxID=1460637 RepID=UPI0006CF836B